MWRGSQLACWAAVMSLTFTVAAETTVKGSITADTVWGVAGSPYLVSEQVTVETGAVLTIEPGVTVRLQAWKRIVVRGAISAKGTASAHIVFTKAEGADNWLSLTVDDGASGAFDYCDFSFGGVLDAAVWKLGAGTLSATNCAFANCKTTGLRIGSDKASVMLSGNHFTSCGTGALVDSNCSFDDTASVFSGNTVDVDLGAVTATSAVVWGIGPTGTGVAYGVMIKAGGGLTIRPGTTVAFKNGGGLSVTGTLTINGEAGAKVTLRGVENTTGYWFGISVTEAGTATLTSCTIVNAGQASGWQGAITKRGTGTLSIAGSSLSGSLCAGISFYDDHGVCSVTGTTISGNDQGIAIADMSTTDLTIRNCSIMGNAKGGVLAYNPKKHFDARLVWWGDASGPFSASENPGGKGDSAGKGVQCAPWKLSDSPTASVTFDALPVGEGIVTPSGAMSVTIGEPLAVAATPAEGHVFARWKSSGIALFDSSTDAKTTVMVGGDTTITAEFASALTLTMAPAAPAGSGTTSPEQGTHVAGLNASKAILATPSSEYVFSNWSVSAGGVVAAPNEASTTVTLSGDATVTANFTKSAYYLTMKASPESMGSTTPAMNLAHKMAANLPKLVTATPTLGFSFLRWEVSGSASVDDVWEAETTVTLTGNATLTAIFSSPATLAISVFPENGGTTTPSSPGEYEVDRGRHIAITATPYPGFAFGQWTTTSDQVEFGDSLSASTTFRINGAATKVELTANFTAAVKLSVVATPEEAGTTTPAVGIHDAPYGVPIAVVATANAGYLFSSWSADQASAVFERSNYYSTYVTIQSDTTVTARFVPILKIPLQITFSAKHDEALKTVTSPGEPVEYEQAAKDSYLMTLKFDISGAGFIPPDPAHGGGSATVQLTFGEQYEFCQQLVDFQKGPEESKFNSLKYDAQKGKAVFVLADYDPSSNSENPPLRKIESFSLAWDAKAITVVVKGTPHIGDEFNIFDFSGAEDGILAGETDLCQFMFGDLACELSPSVVTYTGSKTMKTVVKGKKDKQQEYELSSWSVKGGTP